MVCIIQYYDVQVLEYFIPKYEANYNTWDDFRVYKYPLMDSNLDKIKCLLKVSTYYRHNMSQFIKEEAQGLSSKQFNDNRGTMCYIFQQLALKKDTELMQMLIDNYCDRFKEFIKYAPFSRSIEFITFLLKNGYKLCEKVLITAIYLGDDDIAYWLIKNGCPITDNCLFAALCMNNEKLYHNLGLNCLPISCKLFNGAVIGNCVNIIEQYLDANGKFGSGAYHYIIKNDKVETMNLLKRYDNANTYLDNFNIHCLAIYGSVNMLKWYIANGFEITDHFMDTAMFISGEVHQPNIEIIKWMIENGHEYAMDELLATITLGQKELYTWLYVKGYFKNVNVLGRLLLIGDIDLVKDVLEKGKEIFTRNNWVDAFAKHNQSIKLLDYLETKYGKGYLEVDVFASLVVSLVPQLNVVKWLDKKGYKFSKKLLYKLGRNMEGMRWLINNGYVKGEDFPWDDAMMQLLQDIDGMRLLYNHAPCRDWSTAIMSKAIQICNHNTLVWLRERGVRMDGDTYYSALKVPRNDMYMEWVLRGPLTICPRDHII
jgi:hypothetical protein